MSDHQPTPAAQRQPHGLALAIQFLTILPVWRLQTRHSAGVSQAHDAIAASEAPDMGRALPWFPLVGALIGAALAVVDWALTPLLSLGVRDALLLALAAGLTGLLHLDGFVDCCDGLLGVRSVERRLEIMRDSRVGAYGALGGALLLIARFAALGALASGSELRTLALVAAPLLGRWAMVYAVARYPYARAAGAGAPFRPREGAPGPGIRLAQATAWAAGLLALVVVLLAGASEIRFGAYGVALVFQANVWRTLFLSALLVVALWLIAFVVMLGWARWALRRLGGGLTGDTYGALNELVELAVLVCTPVVAMWVARA